MLDAPVRRLIAPGLDRLAAPLATVGVPPLAVTGAGLVAGLGACVAIAVDRPWLALVLWLVNRLLDGVDGPLARRRGSTEVGGLLDIVADFTVYAGFVLGLGIAHPEARVACLALLTSYYVSGTAFLALSSVLERRGTDLADVLQDGRSLRFAGGIAEGTETVLAYVVFCLLPQRTAVIAWVFTVLVALTALQRVTLGVRLLRHRPPRPERQES